MTPFLVRIFVTRWCRDCHRSIKFLESIGIDLEIIDIDTDSQADEFVRKANRGYRSVPTIVFPDGSILVEPSQQALFEKVQEFHPDSTGVG